MDEKSSHLGKIPEVDESFSNYNSKSQSVRIEMEENDTNNQKEKPNNDQKSKNENSTKDRKSKNSESKNNKDDLLSSNLTLTINEKNSGKNEGQFKKILYKVILIGDYGVGKSSIIERFVNNTFPVNNNKEKSNLLTSSLKISQDTEIFLNIYDTAGEERFSPINTQFYKDAFGVIIVYDITQRETFDNLEKWIKEALKNEPDDIELMIIGNKNDLNEDRQVKIEDGEKISQKYNAIFIEASAKSGNNIHMAFEDFANKIMTTQSEKQREGRETIIINQKVHRDSAKKSLDKKKCCSYL